MGQKQTTPISPLNRAVLDVLVRQTPETERLHDVALAYLAALPPDFRAALVAYTGALSALVNPWLAGETLTLDGMALSEERQRIVRRQIVNLIATVVYSPGMSALPVAARLDVYSGFPASRVREDPDFGRSAADPRSFQIGDPVGWLRNRLISASLSYAIGRKFVSGDLCCIFRMQLVHPMLALPIWSVSLAPNELEVLLPPGYQWRVVARDDAVSPVIITVQCMNPDAFQRPGAVDAMLKELQRAATTGIAQRSGEFVGPWLPPPTQSELGWE